MERFDAGSAGIDIGAAALPVNTPTNALPAAASASPPAPAHAPAQGGGRVEAIEHLVSRARLFRAKQAIVVRELVRVAEVLVPAQGRPLEEQEAQLEELRSAVRAATRASERTAVELDAWLAAARAARAASTSRAARAESAAEREPAAAAAEGEGAR